MYVYLGGVFNILIFKHVNIDAYISVGAFKSFEDI